MVYVFGNITGACDTARRFCSNKSIGLHHLLNDVQTGIAADRLCAALNQLHAVKIDWIMAGGNFDATVNVQMEGREVHFFGAGHAQIDDIRTLFNQAANHGLFQRFAGLADIATNYYFFGLQELRKCPADAIRDVFVQLRAEPTTDVIGFKARQRVHSE